MSTPEPLSASITDEFRAQANVSPLLVRVCATDTEDTPADVWDAYATELVARLVGGALDVAATYTAGPYARQAVQTTFVIPDDGLGAKFRGALADVAARHGLAPYTSWTELEARLRLDRW